MFKLQKIIPFMAILAITHGASQKCSMVDYHDKSGRTGKCCVHWDDEQDTDRIFFHAQENEVDNTTRINEINQNAINSTISDKEVNHTDIIKFDDSMDHGINKTAEKTTGSVNGTTEKNNTGSEKMTGVDDVPTTTAKASGEIVTNLPNRNSVDTAKRCSTGINGECVQEF